MSFIDEKKLEPGKAYVFIVSTGNGHKIIFDRVTESGIFGHVSEEMMYAVYQDKTQGSEQQSGFFDVRHFESFSKQNHVTVMFSERCQFKTGREVGIDKSEVIVAEDAPFPAINRFVEDLGNVTAEEITEAFPQIMVT